MSKKYYWKMNGYLYEVSKEQYYEYRKEQDRHIELLIHEAGKLIFSIVYSIWFMSKKYNIICSIRGECVDIPEQRKREFYFRGMADLRKYIKDQIKDSDRVNDIKQMESLKKSAEEIISKYTLEISNGKRQNKSETDRAYYEHVDNLTIFAQGGQQKNEYKY